MKFRLSRGKNLSLRGTFNILGGNVFVEGITNHDGSPDRVINAFGTDGRDGLRHKGVNLADRRPGTGFERGKLTRPPWQACAGPHARP